MNLGRPVLISAPLSSGTSWATLHPPAIAMRHLLQSFKHITYPLAYVMCSITQWVQLFATPWTAAHQAPLSMEFCRQEYWSSWPLLSPGDHSDPETNPHLLHWQADSFPMCHIGRHSKLSPASIVFFLVREPAPLSPRFNRTHDTQLPCH